LQYVDEKIRRDKQYASELDMVIFSVVVVIIVRCISNYRTGFQEHNSCEFLVHLKNSLTDAGIPCEKLADAISTDVKDIWVYHHRYGLPTEPDIGNKLDHYCLLRPIPSDPIKSSIAYRGINAGGMKAAERRREPLPQEAILPPKPKHDREKRKRKRLNVETQLEIVNLMKQSGHPNHESIAEKYGICRSAITRLLKRGPSIAREMELSHVRDKSLSRRQQSAF
jgi:hypothetical protein